MLDIGDDVVAECVILNNKIHFVMSCIKNDYLRLCRRMCFPLLTLRYNR